MANQDFFTYGSQSPYNTAPVYFGDLRSKGGQGNMLAFLSGQNQAALGQQYKKTQGEQSDLSNRYSDIAGGKYQGISDEDRGILDSLSQRYTDLNSPEAMDNYSREVLTPLRGAFDVARSKASNRLARTGNSAGYGSMLSELAREEGRQSSQAGYQIGNEKYNRDLTTANALSGIANQRFQRSDAGFGKQMQGIQGLANLYGIDMNMLSALQNQSNNIYGMAFNNSKPGTLATINGVANTVKNIAGMAAPFF